jgi:acyl carrier protein phosphodiesterase
MNFLAHLYLSGTDTDIMLGNFIADSVKGSMYKKFKPQIQQGILLHRKIDSFTDNHLITKELATLFRSQYKLHSGIVVDIFYDHFLTVNWKEYSDQKFTDYIQQVHRTLLRNIFVLPPRVKAFLPFFIARNRLYGYSTIEGIRSTLLAMSKYTSLPEASNYAIATILDNYDFFNLRFITFFNEIIEMATKEINRDQNFR